MNMARILLTTVMLLVAASSMAAEIAHPDTTGMDPALAEQIETAREYLDDTADLSPPERAEAYGEIGMLYQATGFGDAALSAYRMAGETDPLDGRWPYLSGLIHAEKGATTRARNAFLQGISLNPALTVSGWTRIGRLFLDQGDPDMAVRAYERALSDNEQSAPALAGMGEAQLALEHYDKAREYLERALDEEPRANRLHYPLAMAYRGLDDEASMHRHLERTGQVGLTPDDPVAEYLAAHASGSRIHILRGQKAWNAGDMAGAAAAFARAVEAAPDNRIAWTNLGTAQAALDQLDKAAGSLQKALELDPEAERARRNLVAVLRQLDKPGEALSVLNAAPGEQAPWQLLARARIRRDQGKPDQAADDLLDYLEDQRDLSVWSEALRALIEADRHDRAWELATHPDLSRSSDPALASVLEALLNTTGLRPADVQLTDRLSEHLYQRTANRRHALIRVNALLARHNNCDPALAWLTTEIERHGDSASQQHEWLSALSRELTHAPQCGVDPDS